MPSAFMARILIMPQPHAYGTRPGSAERDSKTMGIAQIARETGLTRQTAYRIKDDPAGAEAALVVWGL
jgi:Helix-turn-helix domain of resolvase